MTLDYVVQRAEKNAAKSHRDYVKLKRLHHHILTSVLKHFEAWWPTATDIKNFSVLPPPKLKISVALLKKLVFQWIFKNTDSNVCLVDNSDLVYWYFFI